MAGNIDAYTLQSILEPQTQLLQTIATRPQRASVTTSSQPYALADALLAKQRIDQAMKGREGLGYSLANALSEIPQQQGYGTWLSDFARAFGGGLKGSTDDDLARAQKDYENALKLGDIKTQEIDYKPVTETKSQEGGKISAQGGTDDGGIQQYTDIPGIKLHDLNIKSGRWETNKYDPINKDQGLFSKWSIQMLPGRDYGIDKSRGTEQYKNYEQFETVAMKGMYDVLKVLRPATDTDVLTALKTAGADPTMTPENRDKRLTSTINAELRKAGLPQVENLKDWDDTLEKFKRTGEWKGKKANDSDKSTVSVPKVKKIQVVRG